MATETEKVLPVDDFLGINRQLDREDINPAQFWNLQNLAERKVGSIQKIGGSQTIKDTWPSNITGIDNVTRHYIRDIDRRRLLSIHCTPPVAQPSTTGTSAAFVNSGSGNWNKAWGGATYTGLGSWQELNGQPFNAAFYPFQFQWVGYGLRFNTLVTAPTEDASSVLRVTIPSGLDPNLTGVNIYAPVYSGGATSPSIINFYTQVWVGYINLKDNPNGGTFDFPMAPRAYDTGAPLTGYSYDYGNSLPTYQISGTTGGTLTPGQTYYVAVMSDRYSFALTGGGAYSDLNHRYQRANTSQVWVAITLTSTQNAIQINNIAGTTITYGIAIGESPETMAMQFITNSINNTILSIAKHTPNVINRNPVDASNDDWFFLMADPSNRDMLVRIDDDGYIEPIYVTGITLTNSFPAKAVPAQLGAPLSYLNYYGSPVYDIFIGSNSKFRFTQLGDLTFFVNDFDPASANVQVSFGPTGTLVRSDQPSFANLCCTDGRLSRFNIYDFGTTAPPRSKFIRTFQDSLVIGGGTKFSESYSAFYFSDVLNGFNFAQGGTGSLLAFVNVDPNGEPINNIGIYTFGTGIDGPRSQLLVTKKTSVNALTNLPTDFTTDTFMTNLSKRIGSIGDTIVNTTIGTIFASEDNVYMMNNNGDPEPIGDGIEPILRESYMVNAVASFHENMYKLSFASTSESGNDLELWLDVRKFKASKQPIWWGVHVGRVVDYSNVEIMNEDNERKICIDLANKRVYQGDIYGIVNNFGNYIESQIESIDYGMKPAGLTNKLQTRFYWKMTTMKPVTLEDTTTIDEGRIVETQTLEIAPPEEATWAQGIFDNDLFEKAWTKVYPFFYQGRLVGRLVRKKLVHKGPENISFSGLALHFKIETRRI